MDIFYSYYLVSKSSKIALFASSTFLYEQEYSRASLPRDPSCWMNSGVLFMHVENRIQNNKSILNYIVLINLQVQPQFYL